MIISRIKPQIYLIRAIKLKPLSSYPSPHRHTKIALAFGSISLHGGHSHGIVLQTSSFISLPGTGGPAKKREFSERRLMGFSMEQMFDVVADVENYKDFLPWCESSEVISQGKGYIDADLVIGMKPVTESYTSNVKLFRPHLIRAESTQGRHFNTMVTQWKFAPGLRGKPRSCVVDFYVSLEFKSLLHSQIANVFFNEVVRAMAGAFFNEARRRYGQESVPSRKIAILPTASSSSKTDEPT